VRDNGRVSIVSLLGRGEEPADFNPLAMKYFYHKSVSLIAVNGSAPYLYPVTGADRMSWNKQCEYVLQLMADGSLKPSQIVTHRLHYSRMKEAYEMAYHREKTMLGVIFQWDN
jgi:threonine dehydrogenase-like Zn-dependent dehydrogenase